MSGIILALIAFYFTTKKEVGQSQNTNSLLLPMLVFIGPGTIDSSLKYLQTYHVPSEKIDLSIELGIATYLKF